MVIILAGALLIFGGAELARRAKLPEAIGSGATLWLIAIGLGLFVANWPAWRAGDAGGDRLLTYAQLVGLTGMFFLAGSTFRLQNIRRTRIAGFAGLGALLLVITTVLFSSLAKQPLGTAAFIAASFVSSSLWFPAAFRTAQRNEQTVAVDPSAAIALSAVAMFGAHLAEVLSAIPAARSTATAYAIVTLYELVKLAVVFGFAYFIATRFVARAHGRISQVRTNVGFILIAILFFALISIAIGTIASMAWAFVAGALWRKTEVGDEFGERPKPIASALLLSLVFVSLPLQFHGRELSLSRVVIVAAVVAIALKLFSAWAVLSRASIEKRETLFVSAAMVFPGEMAVLFLSVAVSRFVIDGPIFFILLAYAFLSALLVPALLSIANSRPVRAGKQPREPIYQP